MELSSTFAMSTPKTKNIYSAMGYNYAHTSASYRKDIGCCFPMDAHNRVMCIVFGETGGSSLSYILFNTFPYMPKTESIGSAVNNSNRSSASAREKGTSYADIRLLCNNPYSIPTFEDFIVEACRRFDEECAAKNMAYYFIMSLDLIERFHEFCRIHEGEDGHAGCVDILLNNQ